MTLRSPPIILGEFLRMREITNKDSHINLSFNGGIFDIDEEVAISFSIFIFNAILEAVIIVRNDIDINKTMFEELANKLWNPREEANILALPTLTIGSTMPIIFNTYY